MLQRLCTFQSETLTLAIALACATSACTAQISGDNNPPELASGGTTASGTGGVSPGTSGTGGSPGAGGAVSAGGGGAMPATGGSATGTGGTGPVGSGGSAGMTDCTQPAQVSFRVMTRLNRAEYDNTVRDLLGDTGHLPLTMLPADYGDGAFDNNAAALTINPSLVETYVELAETLAERAVAQGSPGRALVLTCGTADDGCARQIAENFATRAWRRPVTTVETDGLFSLFQKARELSFSFEEGIQAIVAGALLSPDFLFRPEIDPVIDSPEGHDVSPYELASRLSYFLWSSMPDSALMAAASSGALASNDGVRSEVSRMWADQKADAFVARFPGLWLRTADVTVAKRPAEEIYPAFEQALEHAMEQETALFMRDMITGDVDFLDFLDAKYTYVNEKLAQFYGLSGQFTDGFSRADLAGNPQRGGILTHASVLTVTSPAERTSPVIRGQWVLSRLLATPSPPPPEDVPALDPTPTEGLSMRQKLELHRADPNCAGCHNLIDPLGLGLENYDGIGSFRTMDNGVPIDASGELESGETFVGALELAALLHDDPRVPRAVAQYLLSYALGREPGADDQCLIDSLNAAFEQGGRRFSALVTNVATSAPMRQRRGAL